MESYFQEAIMVLLLRIVNSLCNITYMVLLVVCLLQSTA